MRIPCIDHGITKSQTQLSDFHFTSLESLDETQARIKITLRNIKNLRYADDTTGMAESKEELKSLLMKVKKRRVKKLA